MPPKQKPGSSKQDYSTPQVFVDAVKKLLEIKEFKFDFAADAGNAKAPRWWSKTNDSLSHYAGYWAEQIEHGWGWLNPPFAHIGPWAEKCMEVKRHEGQVALLVPAAVGSNWFRDYVDGHAQVLFLNGRLAFMPDKPKWLYPKDCILCLYSPVVAAQYEVWKWRHHED